MNLTQRNPLPVSASFADYFKMGLPPDEILAQFGYSFARERLALPHSERLPANLEELRHVAVMEIVNNVCLLSIMLVGVVVVFKNNDCTDQVA